MAETEQPDVSSSVAAHSRMAELVDDDAKAAGGEALGQSCTESDLKLHFPLTQAEEDEGIRRLQGDAEALRRLREENALLRSTLTAFQRKMRREAPAGDAGVAEAAGDADDACIGELQKSLGTAEGTRALCDELQRHIDSPQFLATLHNSQAVLVANADSTDEVGILDLDDAEWWTLVNPPVDTARKVETGSLGGAYVFVDRQDVVEAIGEFVAMYLASVPAAQHLSSEQLQGLLSGTFSEFREKGSMESMWSWGRFLYATYGWGMTGISLYRDPGMALYVMRALWTACRWACFLAL